MSLIQIIKSWFYTPKINFGITNSDLATGATSPSIVQQKEIVISIANPTFKGVNNNNIPREFPYMFQSTSSACVTFTTAKIAMIIKSLIDSSVILFSAGWFYTQRVNKPQQGTNFDDLVNIASTKGCLVDSMMPSFGLSETALDSLQITQADIIAAEQYKLPPHWVDITTLTTDTFDAVASTIEITKKPIMLWFTFGAGEFFFTQYPRIVSSTNPWVHSVTATDTVTIGGIQYIVIEESADSVNFFRKYITREFFTAKCLLARYPITFVYNETSNKPIFDGSIQSLQDCLRYLKFFPSNVASTGFLGTITTNALIAFQKANNISPSVGNFGDITKAKLLELFNI